MNNILNDLVSFVINKNFKIFYLWTGKKTVFEKSDELIEPKKELNGIMTELLINEFVKTTEQSQKFLELIYDSFNDALREYKTRLHLSENDIVFLYKGGNILRIVSQEVYYELPGTVVDKLKNFYNDSFKKSDADFTIYINPQLSNFDIILEDINNLTFLLQNYIRNILLSNKEEYFEFFRLNMNQQSNILLEYLKKLNETDIVKEDGSKFNGTFDGIVFNSIKTILPRQESLEKVKTFDLNYQVNADYEMGFEVPRKTIYRTDLKYLHNLDKNNNNNFAQIIKTEEEIYRENTSNMYISINKTLSYGNNNKISSFNLIRTKVSFNTYFSKKYSNESKLVYLAGELIDVSIIRKDDSYLEHFMQNINKYISDYTVKKGDGNYFKFKAYSLESLVDDLEKILFEVAELPWLDAKYTKRLKRLIFMYFLILMTNKHFSNKHRILYLRLLKEKIINNILISDKPYNEVLGKIYSFLKKSRGVDNEKSYPFRRLVKNLAKILMTKNIDKNDLNQYINAINENINIILISLETLEQFNQTNGTIQELSIYELDEIK